VAKQQQVLEQLVLDLVTFNQEAERQLQALCQVGFPGEEYDRISGLATSNLKALEQMLDNPAAKLTSEAVANLVALYKAEVRDQIAAVQARLYSGRQLRLRMKELLRTKLSEVSSRLQAERQSSQRYLRTQIDRVKQIRAEIDQLQADCLARFGKILQIEGENWRSEVFEEVLEDYSAALPAIFNRHLFEGVPEPSTLSQSETQAEAPQCSKALPDEQANSDPAVEQDLADEPNLGAVSATSMTEASGLGNSDEHELGSQPNEDVPELDQTSDEEHALEQVSTSEVSPPTPQLTALPDPSEVLALTAQLQSIVVETERVMAELRSLLASAELVSARLRFLQTLTADSDQTS